MSSSPYIPQGMVPTGPGGARREAATREALATAKAVSVDLLAERRALIACEQQRDYLQKEQYATYKDFLSEGFILLLLLLAVALSFYLQKRN